MLHGQTVGAGLLFFFTTVVSYFSFLVNEIEENGENAAGSVTGKKKGNAAGQDLASVVGVHAPANERGTERGTLETRAVETLAVGRGTGSVRLYQQEKTTGVGKGVEKERNEAEARTARGKGREERGLREKTWLRETGRWRALSGYWRNMKQKLPRGWRSVETGSETATGTADAATGIESDAGGTGTGIETTKETVTETGASAKRSTTAPYKTTWPPRMTLATRTREEQRHTWRSTARTG